MLHLLHTTGLQDVAVADCPESSNCHGQPHEESAHPNSSGSSDSQTRSPKQSTCKTLIWMVMAVIPLIVCLTDIALDYIHHSNLDVCQFAHWTSSFDPGTWPDLGGR